MSETNSNDQIAWAVYMEYEYPEHRNLVGAYPSLEAAKRVAEDLPEDSDCAPVYLPVRLVPVPVDEMPPSEWISSRLIELDPQQLVGHRVEMASKDGGGWVGKVASYDKRTKHYTVVDGTERRENARFALAHTWLFDIARARIIKEQ